MRYLDFLVSSHKSDSSLLTGRRIERIPYQEGLVGLLGVLGLPEPAIRHTPWCLGQGKPNPSP